MKYLLTIILAVLLSGCMASSFNEMVKKPSIHKKSFIIKQNYQKLYKNSLDMAEQCYEHGMLTAAIVSDGQLFTETKSARISIYLMGGLGKQMYYAATFKALDNNTTELVLFSEMNDKVLETMKKEFTGECKKCGCDK